MHSTEKKRDNRIELLAPARTAQIGKEAVLHGADAVYIGGPAFGARAAAGNSVEEIEELCKLAHVYHAKVNVTLNTILTDQELTQAEKLIWRLYEAGVDALIVQDYGITMLGLPPIALHASTQMDTRTPQKALFLQQAGFEQVVIARESNIDEIKAIADATTVKIEAFVHGALCVSFSGQCYSSCALTARSANRGECSQLCRLKYDLSDSKGNVHIRGKHLLSLRDLNLSDYLGELINAGVSSFKIEGRLKNAEYVKNVTAYYRQRLDDLLEKDPAHSHASSGHCIYTFQPDVYKSFNRGFTDYFLHGRHTGIASIDTPKSQGEPIGNVTAVSRLSIDIATTKEICNGDGLCYMSPGQELVGFNVNRAEKAGNGIFRVFPPKMKPISIGTDINRNIDATLNKTLGKPSAERKIDISINIERNNKDIVISATDEDGITACIHQHIEPQTAQNTEMARKNLQQQMSRLGNTPFAAKEITATGMDSCFIPSSALAQWRRELVDALIAKRESVRPKSSSTFKPTFHPFVTKEVDYRGNIYNTKARMFMEQHGVTRIEPAYETGKNNNEVELMLCRHCIRHMLGCCLKTPQGKNLPSPLFITDRMGNRLRLEFDCNNCQMKVMGRRTANPPLVW